MSFILRALKIFSVTKLLLLAFAVLKALSEKSKNVYDDAIVEIIEKTIENLKEYEEKLKNN